MALNTTEEILDDLRAGRMVVIMDDEDRENEGDLLMVADAATADDINFMARYGRGLICLTLTSERCRRLNLPLMVNGTNASQTTNFTVSIEAARGVTTGISAADRAATIRAAVAPDAGAEDIVQPGHVFPLMAQPGGVLTRAGHTEAGCDLARLAGHEPAAVIVEILKEDGSMARRADLERFAREHGLKIGTIADLIRFRIENEKTVEHVTECALPTEFGEFRLVIYQDTIDNHAHMALVRGEIDPDRPVLVRVHLQNALCDLTASTRPECGWPLRDALKRVADEGNGVVVILCRQDSPQDIINRVGRFQHDAAPADPQASPSRRELRTFGVGAQILSDLGVRRMRVLSAPVRMHGLSGFGLEVVEYVN